MISLSLSEFAVVRNVRLFRMNGKHQVLLLQKHHITESIVRGLQQRHFHVHQNGLCSIVREHYWLEQCMRSSWLRSLFFFSMYVLFIFQYSFTSFSHIELLHYLQSNFEFLKFLKYHLQPHSLQCSTIWPIALYVKRFHA